MNRLLLIGSCTFALLAACDDDDSSVDDSGVTDSGVVDTGVADSGPTDSGSADAGSPDSGVADSGLPDTGPTAAQICIDTCQASLACYDDSEVGVCTVYCEALDTELLTAGCADEVSALVTCQRGAPDICDENTCLGESDMFRNCLETYCRRDAGDVSETVCTAYDLTDLCGPGPWKCD